MEGSALQRLKRKNLKLKGLVIDLREQFQELQNRYLVLETKLNEEQ